MLYSLSATTGRITYPVVADNEYSIWNAFGNQYWPAHYIFDARGHLLLAGIIPFAEGGIAKLPASVKNVMRRPVLIAEVANNLPGGGG
jgi:hypothetical protein